MSVGLAQESRQNVLAVPVDALVARRGGGYGVELAGSRRIVPVERGHVRRRVRGGIRRRHPLGYAAWWCRVSEARANGGPVLEIHGLTKRYPGGVDALRGVDMVVEEGELLCVVGPSGSGKSTLLHIMGTLERPSEGTVRVAGHDVAALSDRQLAALRARHWGSSSSSSSWSRGRRRGRERRPGTALLGRAGAATARPRREQLREGRPGPPAHAPPDPALRRRAPARRDRAGARRAALDHLRGRADRQPRHAARARRSSGSCAS